MTDITLQPDSDLVAFEPFPDVELPHTLPNGWVHRRGHGLVHDPELAALTIKCVYADHPVLFDCLSDRPFTPTTRGTP